MHRNILLACISIIPTQSVAVSLQEHGEREKNVVMQETQAVVTTKFTLYA
jgi:hypothetical protein